MKFRSKHWMLALVAAAGLIAADRSDPAKVMMEAARKKEVVDGDLNGAIQAYGAIAVKYKADRAVAAMALFHMADCYQKMGDAESRKLYEQIVKDYADQTQAVALARARLGGRAKPSQGPGIVTRQIWADALDNEGAPSPDGRYLSFVDWETGDLAIRDLTTGENRRLTDKGPWEASEEFALYSVFSPDGRQVAYSWFNGDKDQSWDIRVVSVDGTKPAKPRVLFTSKHAEYVAPSAWSQDGRRILTIFSGRDLTHKIGLLTVADASMRTVKTLDWRVPVKLSLSPDGRYIAYDFPPKEDSQQRDIYVLATDGSRESVVVEHPANDYAPVWTPDGGKLLFTSTRSGAASEWIVAVADGKAQGTPDLLKADVGQMEPMAFTRKGSLFFSLLMGDGDVYTADVDSASQKLQTAPKRITERFTGLNRGADWSPDGRRLAFVSTRSFSTREPGSTLICIREFATGEQRELRPELSYFQKLRWSPDGKSFAVWGTDRKGRKGIFRVDAENGRTTPLVNNGEDVRNAMWSPDGRVVYYDYYSTGRLVALHLATGVERELLPPGQFRQRLALSPDGSEIAMLVPHQESKSVAIAVMPSKGGELREIHTFRGSKVLEWTRDGKRLVFGSGTNDNTELWTISSAGGQPEKLDTIKLAASDLRFSPDGRRIAFNAGGSKTEIWEMDNFLPPQTARR